MYINHPFLLASTCVAGSILGLATFNPKYEQQPTSGQILSAPLDLTPYLNNQGFGKDPGEANFDGYGSTYKRKPIE
jgi:hypothetical protein